MSIYSATHIRFLEKLKENLEFIKNSSKLFDEGSEAEGIRIATSLRTIFHQTNNSTSLIQHLAFQNKKMLTSSRGYGDWKDYLRIQVDFNSQHPVKMLPMLESNFHEISILDWWKKEVIFEHETKKYTRMHIVLHAANKDGGAHVDATLDRFYESLIEGKHGIGITGNLTFNGPPTFEQGVTHYPHNTHIALLRQFAHETMSAVAYYKWL